MAFVHFGIHSEFSITDSIVRIKSLVKQAAADGQSALALTDLSNLYATVKFYRACLNEGIKPIIGSEVVMDNEMTHITLLAMNQVGYQNLMKIVSLGFTDGLTHGVPIIQQEQIWALNEGIIVLFTEKSDVGQLLMGAIPEKADDLIRQWQSHFSNRLYFAVKRTNRMGEDAFIEAAILAGERFGIPLIAHNDVRFLAPEDFDAHEARICIASSQILADPKRPRLYSEEQYLKTQEQMQDLFSDLPQVIENTALLAKRCNVILTLGTHVLPEFPIPEGETIESFFRKTSEQGLEARLEKLYPVDLRGDDWSEIRQSYDERLAYEIDIILSMGFPGYFLIVMDFIRWAKDNGVPVGPGRGSGAGSLVAYALNITDLDPLHYDLLFERFLNPERVSMPDFDVDFCIDGRDRVIDYVAQTYGREAVSQIITFGTMAAKAVVRDVARVQGKSYGLADKISKLIPKTPGISLASALESEPQLKELLSNPEGMDYDDANEIWEMAVKLEGITRNVGKHAGGVLIAPNKITDFSAIYCDEEGHRVSQFDKDDVEAVGLVKFDFLGLRNLTVINAAVKNINERRLQEGKEAIQLEDLPLDDKNAYQLLQKAKTTAVFQLESAGMKKYLTKLKPTNIEDVIAMCALYRPGPLDAGMVEMYINRKHGFEEVNYDHPFLEPILQNTNGVIVYQEQVMQISQVMAGYSLGGADMLRRAMGKKKPEEMAKQRDIFVNGATEKGIDKQISGGVFDLMEKFAGYGFNKSHSAAYGVLAYQTAYLKHYYPAEFMAAVLTSDMNNTDNVVFFINDCRENFGLRVENPCVNLSNWEFVAKDAKTIMYGLGAVKGVGEGAVESIIEARKLGGKFKDLYDFCRRVDTKKVNKRTLEALVKAGCFDGFAQALRPDLPEEKRYEIRGSLMSLLPKAVQAAEQEKQNESLGMMDLFGGMDDMVSDGLTLSYDEPEIIWSDKFRLKAEKDTLGLYLTGHPIDEYRTELVHYTSVKRLDELLDAKNVSCYFAGLIIDVANFGNRCVISFDDGTSRLEASCFAERFNRLKEHLKVDEIVVVKGNIRERNGKPYASIEDVFSLIEARQRWIKAIRIKIHGDNLTLLNQLQPLLKSAQIEQIPQIVIQHEDSKNSVDVVNEDGYSDTMTEEANSPALTKKYSSDGCIAMALSVYNDHSIANVSLSEHWRMYPSDENLYQLKNLVPVSHLHFHYA